MKKLLILATLVVGFALSNVKAQTVNGLRLSEITADYIQVKQIERDFSKKVFVALEYGQIASDLDHICIKDDNGKRMEFNSALEFVNKLKSYGYELFQVFLESSSQKYGSTAYVLKRK
ncbi:hypothetical protein G6M26_11140 [Agrobacterium tumefaciens]|nr:hypothetical protein [Agrobacterium tumefaciens]NTE19076.1 hypothetical protein [Agrobacterium tumefaciens]